MAIFNLATPDQGASKSVKTRVLEGRFGDGYSQIVGDGLNNVYEEWELAFTRRSKSVIDSIDAFLRARGGYDVFDWTTPDGVSIKVVCKEWSRPYTLDGDSAIYCRFQQEFRL